MRTLIWVVIAIVAAGLGTAAAGGQVAAEVAEPAISYVEALATGNPRQAWDLLSSASRAKMSPVEWEEAFAPGPPRRPAPHALLRALASEEKPPEIPAVHVRPGEALVQLSGAIPITRQVVLVRESVGWRVDLSATDELSSREAALRFLEILTAEGAASPRPGQMVPAANLPLMRSVLAAEATGYQAVAAEDLGDNRMLVTLRAEVPVDLVLRQTRAGPGWMVDTARPLVTVDTTAEDPLAAAAASFEQSACEEQLRQLARAMQMYLAASDGRFPDPDRWLDQLHRFLPADLSLRCPADREAGVSYAFNRNLAGLRRREVANPAGTPMLFASTLHGANPADGGESWPEELRHPAGNLVAFVDGSVRPMRRAPSFAVTRQEPPGPTVIMPGERRAPTLRAPAPQ